MKHLKSYRIFESSQKYNQEDIESIKSLFLSVADDWNLDEVKDCFMDIDNNGGGYYSFDSYPYIFINIILPFKNWKVSIDIKQFKSDMQFFQQRLKKSGYSGGVIYYLDDPCNDQYHIKDVNCRFILN